MVCSAPVSKINLSGKILLNGEGSENATLSVKDYSTGVYILNIVIGEELFNYKLMVK